MLELKQGAYSFSEFLDLHEIIAEQAIMEQEESEKQKNANR